MQNTPVYVCWGRAVQNCQVENHGLEFVPKQDWSHNTVVTKQTQEEQT